MGIRNSYGILLVTLAVLFVTMSAPALAASDPAAAMFHGGPGHAGVYAGNGTLSGTSIIWSYNTGAAVSSSPAIVDGVLYVGSADHNVYALDASTGALKWKYATGGEIWSSPAVADGVVYIDSNDNYTYALDAISGTLLWKFQSNQSVMTTSPTVVNGVVYVGSYESLVYALDAKTGALKWEYAKDPWGGYQVLSSPAVVDGVVYIGSFNNRIYALDAGTGVQKWNFSTGYSVLSSPAVVDGTVYVGSEDNNVYALDAGTGALKWKYATGDQVMSSPAVSGGVVYIGSSDNNLYALDAVTGTLKWKYTMGDYVTGGRMTTSPAVVGSVVYVGSSDSNFYALDASTGALLSENAGILSIMYGTGNWLWSSPVVSDGIVYIGSRDGHIYALGSGSAGATTAQASTPAPTAAGAAAGSTTSGNTGASGNDYAGKAGVAAAAVVVGTGLAIAGTFVVRFKDVIIAAASKAGSGIKAFIDKLLPVDTVFDFFYGLGKSRSKSGVLKKMDEIEKDTARETVPLFLGFSSRELAIMVVASLLLGAAYIVSKKIDLLSPENLLVYCIIAGFVLIIHDLTHRYVADRYKAVVEYKFWGLGAITMFVTALIFGIVYSVPARTIINDEKKLSARERAIIYLSGPLMSAVLAIGFLVLVPVGGFIATICLLGVSMNLLAAVYSLVPIEPLDGVKIYEWKKPLWAAAFVPLLLLYLAAVIFLL